MTETTKCMRCGRTLTAARSIARGAGRACSRKLRVEKACAEFKPAQITKALELIADGGMQPVRRNRIFRAVSSDGTTSYLTAPEACTCKAGLIGRYVCYHRVAAIMLHVSGLRVA